jgi:signal peptidase I
MLRLFLGAAAVLGWVFDASLVLRRARRGPWRAEVAEGSMASSLLPGDWLFLDPTGGRWPRPGSIVVIREPGTGILAIKRVAARGVPGGGRAAASGRGGERSATTAPDGLRRPLEPREAWLLGDAPADSIDSRAYGPLDADALVARAWFRYGPPGRIGRVR